LTVNTDATPPTVLSHSRVGVAPGTLFIQRSSAKDADESQRTAFSLRPLSLPGYSLSRL
jgi:hypothetical protein